MNRCLQEADVPEWMKDCINKKKKKTSTEKPQTTTDP